MFETPDTSASGPAAAHALLGAGIDAMLAADPTALPVAELGRRLAELQAQTDALAGLSARWAGVFESSGGPEDAGAPTMAAWSRRELRLTPAEARRRTRAAHALDKLPAVRHALFAGQVRMAHVDAIADGVHRLGSETIAGFEDVLLDVARTCDPAELRQAVEKVRDVLDPDAADAAYVRAMEKRDVTVTAVGDGFALGGFLPPDTGAMLKDVLWAGAKPAGADDARTAGQRRTDALHDLCAAVLDHGPPSDRGMRPHG